jgi:hypothetical protein
MKAEERRQEHRLNSDLKIKNMIWLLKMQSQVPSIARNLSQNHDWRKSGLQLEIEWVLFLASEVLFLALIQPVNCNILVIRIFSEKGGEDNLRKGEDDFQWTEEGNEIIGFGAK